MLLYSHPKTLDSVPSDNVTVAFGLSVLVDNQPVADVAIADIDQNEIDATEDFKTNLDLKQKNK